MRVAFYAPMKPPGSPAPSGDRAVARLLVRALEAAGHAPRLASRFRAWAADPVEQARRRAAGARAARRLVGRYRAAAEEDRPELWFTYHLYYKAPDWLGPAVADALAIPYVVAEASHAPKRASGPWAMGHAAAAAAIRRADAVIGLNPVDRARVEPLLAGAGRLHALAPFVDTAPFAAAAAARARHRARLARALALDPGRPILLAAAMMRAGDKLASYRVLAEALSRLAGESWTLAVAGDGPARPEVEAAFAVLPPGRARFLGQAAARALPGLYAAADLFVWPAVREAYGMALLEAQAAGLPAVAANSGGVAQIVAHGRTGLLAAEGDAGAFAEAVRGLLRAPGRRAAFAAAARRKAGSEHGLARASAALDRILVRAAAGGGR